MTTWQERTAPISPGDAVSYKTSYLFREGMLRTSLAQLTGRVIGIEEDKARIEWHTPHDEELIPLDRLSKLTGRGIFE